MGVEDIIERLGPLARDRDNMFDIGIARAAPIYDEPLKDELSRIVNCYINTPIPPFIIDYAKESTDANGEPTLELKGHYEAFDGLKMAVDFSGVRGDPRDKGLVDVSHERDSFYSYTLNAGFMEISPEQEEMLKQINMRYHEPRFYGTELSETTFDGAKYRFIGRESKSGLGNISRIGKLLAFYELSNSLPHIEKVREEGRKFISRLEEMGASGWPIETSLNELSLSPDGFLEGFVNAYMKSMGHDSMGGIKFSSEAVIGVPNRELLPGIIKEEEEDKGGLEKKALINPRLSVDGWSHNRSMFSHKARFSYEVADDSWEVYGSWPAAKLLFMVRDFERKTKSGWKMDENTRRYVECLDFMIHGMGAVQEEPYGCMDIDSFMFDNYVLDARQKFSEDKDYVPIYQTADVEPKYYPEEGGFLFRELSQYLVFRQMMDSLIENSKNASPSAILASPGVADEIKKHREINERMSRFLGFYNSNPNDAWKKLYESDPAYVEGKKEYNKEQRAEHSN